MVLGEEQWNDLSDYRESLEHHGVKNQKHGVRRGPPYPLSANQKKYGKAGAKMDDEKKKRASEKAQERREARAEKRVVKAKTRSERRAAAAKARSEHNAAKKAARAERRRRNILDSPQKLYKHRKEFTYDEIQEAMKRFKWEEELSNYSAKRIENGSNFVKNLMNYSSNAIGLYNNAARIINSVSDDDGFNLPTIRPVSDFYRKKDDKKDDKKDKK